MQPAIHIEKSVAMAFDADVLAVPDKDYFVEAYWRSQNAVTGTAKGRGNSWFIDAPFGQVVLRRYLRGGWAARISRDRYFYIGVEYSRPFQEFSVLVGLLNLGLPVPEPVAALCDHKGLLSRGALITRTIDNARTLADFLPQSSAVQLNGGTDQAISAVWQNAGRCIKRFHQAGLWHADLNARNILLDGSQKVYLIDFDRARLTPGKPVDGRDNLARLKRSLLKLNTQGDAELISGAWTQLMEAYDD